MRFGFEAIIVMLQVFHAFDVCGWDPSWRNGFESDTIHTYSHYETIQTYGKKVQTLY